MSLLISFSGSSFKTEEPFILMAGMEDMLALSEQIT